MIIRFTVKNYKSIYKPVELSFIAESIKQHESNNLIETDFTKTSLLKTLAIYGANASGKTNLIKAIAFMKDFVLTSTLYSQSSKSIDIEPFKLLHKSSNEPSKFEAEFIVHESRYVYGFYLTKNKIEEEYLHLVLKTTKKKLFLRRGNEIILNNSFSEGFGKENFVRPTTLFISTLAQLNGHVALSIVDWFSNITIVTENNYPSFTGETARMFQNNKSKTQLLKLFTAAGLDFENVEIKSINIDENLMQFLSLEVKELVRKNAPEQFKVFTRHKVYNLKGEQVDSVDFDLKEESAGSQKFFAIAGPIVNCLLNGFPIIIDELDARLHPKLVKFIVSLFSSAKHNPYGGQLVFSNHMLELMDRKLLRRDQILLLSKTKMGTDITSIHKQGARSDTSFKNDYLSGEFGTLPDIEFNQLDLF